MSSEIPIRSRVAVIADALEKPELDERSYRVIRLPNQLEAVLIHDPKTDKASAAIDVNVGSFKNAKDLPGLAHAVEHLLFMGTDKVKVISVLKGSSANSVRVLVSIGE